MFDLGDRLDAILRSWRLKISGGEDVSCISRVLVDKDGVVTVDGDNPPSGGGGGVVDGQQLFDGSHALSLDAGARQAIASDGTTTVIDWSDPIGAALTVKGLLRNNIAYLGPHGDDTTGVVGDPAKPFATLQGAITYCETNNFNDVLVDIGQTSSSSDITTSLTSLQIRGADAAFVRAFGSIHFTEPSTDVSFSAFSCQIGGLTSDSTGSFLVQLEGVYTAPITCGGALYINRDQPGSPNWLGGDITAGGLVLIATCPHIQKVTAGGAITINGAYTVGNVSAPGHTITIHHAHEIGTIVAGSTVTIVGARIANVTACDHLILQDSRVVGTNGATTTTLDDAMLNPNKFNWSSVPTSDPHVVGAPWNNSGILTISAG